MNATQRGYSAWQAGKPMNAQAGPAWIEGWRAGSDGEWWQRVAAAIGARLHGWSYRHSAAFVFPNGEYHTVDGMMAQAVARLASADTHPKGGDAKQAPFMSGAVGDSRDAQTGDDA